MDIRSQAEREAYDKAACVYRAMTEAGKVFTPSTGLIASKVTDETRARAKRELEAFDDKARAGVRSCLTREDVIALGRYSFLEDMTFAVGSGCSLTKTPALGFERTPNNNEGDMINGAVKWELLTDQNGRDRPLESHPFFAAQAQAREELGRADRNAICRLIVHEFGPTGTRFPGLIRPKR
jgi:hypothetical protein